MTMDYNRYNLLQGYTRVRLVLFLIIVEVYKINGKPIIFMREVYNFYEGGEYEKIDLVFCNLIGQLQAGMVELF